MDLRCQRNGEGIHSHITYLKRVRNYVTRKESFFDICDIIRCGKDLDLPTYAATLVSPILRGRKEREGGSHLPGRPRGYCWFRRTQELRKMRVKHLYGIVGRKELNCLTNLLLCSSIECKSTMLCDNNCSQALSQLIYMFFLVVMVYKNSRNKVLHVFCCVNNSLYHVSIVNSLYL